MCAFVCQTNVNCVFVVALCARDGEPRCPRRVWLRTGLTSRLMDEARRDFLRSPVAVNVVKLAPDQATARHFLLIVCPHRFFCDDKTCKMNLLGEEKKHFLKNQIDSLSVAKQ